MEAATGDRLKPTTRLPSPSALKNCRRVMRVVVIMVSSLRCLLDRGNDAHVRTATTEVPERRRLSDAGQEVLHFVVGRNSGIARSAPPPQPVVGAHHDAGNAIGALPRLVIDEGLLYPFGIVRLPESFNGGHLRSVGDRIERRDARPIGDTVDDDGAGAAQADTAAEFYAPCAH